MKLCFVSSHAKNNLKSLPYLDDVLNPIGNTDLNNEKRFLEFQSIFCDGEFCRSVKNLLKVQESKNNFTKYILSFMYMIGISFMNIVTLWTKEWDFFLTSIRLMIPWIDDGLWQYNLQLMITSVFDGNVFLLARALSINKRNHWLKGIFLFVFWPLDKYQYE